MSIDWKLVQRVVDYYVLHGGKIDKNLAKFLNPPIADYCDQMNESLAETRLYPLFKSYLQGGIVTRADKKEVGCLLDFLMDITRNPLPKVRYEGTTENRKFLLKGEGSIMARQYDNKWYLDSVENVIEGIEVTINYLQTIKDDLPSDSRRAEADIVVAKYEALRDRVLPLKDAVPESQVAISEKLKSIMEDVVKEQQGNLLNKQFYPSARSMSEKENVFLRVEKYIKEAEALLSTPPKKGKLPSDNEKIGAFVGKGDYKDIIGGTNVKYYREQCRALRDTIDEDLLRKKEGIKEMMSAPDELQEELNKAVEERKNLELKKQDLWRKYQNGMVNEKQLEIEKKTMIPQQKMLDKQIDNLTSLISRTATPTGYALQQQELYNMQNAIWLSIKSAFRSLLDSSSEERKLIKHFEKIKNSLTILSQYVNGITNKNGTIDLTEVKTTLGKIEREIKAELAFANGIIENPDGFFPETETSQTQAENNTSLEEFFGSTNSAYVTNEPSATEFFRPNTDAAGRDPIPTDDNDTSSSYNIFGIRMGNHDGNDGNN